MAMKAMVVLLLASLPVPQVQIPSPQPAPRVEDVTAGTPAVHSGGKWYFARSGHAVYCYGPVLTIPGADGGLEHVATFCHGGQLLVPLKD
jgi:hypothetical protein